GISLRPTARFWARRASDNAPSDAAATRPSALQRCPSIPPTGITSSRTYIVIPAEGFPALSATLSGGEDGKQEPNREGAMGKRILSVGLIEPGHVHRGGIRGVDRGHTVYRTGEVHGRITERAQEVYRLVSHADSAKVTDNLWGERWSKLVTNSMANGVSACTGLSGAQMAQNEAIRRFQARLGGEAIRIGQALGYKLEEIGHLPPEIIARAGEGDRDALARYEEHVGTQPRGSAEQRPSMGQDMAKGRRTELEFLNGVVVREGEKVGLAARANERLVDIVKKVE